MSLTELEYNLLNLIESSPAAVGSNSLAQKLKNIGFDTSAPTVGRALARLEKAGYLLQVKKKGRVISEEGNAVLYRRRLKQNLDDAANDVVKILGAKSSADVKQLIDVVVARKALEKEAARLAARNATQNEVASICAYGEILDTILKEAHESYSKNHQATMGRLFHETIAKASHNELLFALIRLVNQDVAARDFLVVLLERTNYSFGLGHTKIAEAIKSRDEETAGMLAAEHIQKIIDALSLLLNDD